MGQSPRFFRRSLALLAAVALLFFTLRHGFAPQYLGRSSAPSIDSHGHFWLHFHRILKAAAPDCKSPRRIEDHPKAIGFRPDATSNVTLPQHIVVDKEDLEKLTNAHERLMTLLSAPSSPKLAYHPRSKGIVTTAGGSFLPVVVTSLHMLRQTGSTLPLEIFIADPSEHDAYICDSLLPTLNARCITLSDILAYSPLAAGLKKYQFKIFALLFSSFEDVLFLDADAFPIRDPTPLFSSEPFASHGLVTWPDFWQVTYHPAFFNITAQDLPTGFDYASTESGQLLVSKKSHGKMLLLSAYYNFYGPSHYYPLLSQGHPGEGDKETFIPPARILNLPFYPVSTGPAVLGYRKHDGQWEGGVIMQASPTWDFKQPKGHFAGWRDKPRAPPESFLTCHANLPKLEPIGVFGDKGLAWSKDRRPQRMWGSARDIANQVGHDMERHLWIALGATACDLEGQFKPWQGKPKLCATIKKFIVDMEGQ
ncbi:mannosyltransferase [Ophidiomyces ophidiicola]|uniref:mannosyltransferase n=1 Tax=Ophidiomyces ophidiicola TaxID=1387563 RepID=UPI0020C3487F|nr:mannosyltransferase [Ophidiomyces ophidiicola]KAI1914775.1 mannosyltransferase [Ophidiomyces ophidiicola]KAI1954019.1 mannosyltransferase [Ophidiomyces ophidiicola]KAI2012476.1 mannosyltransferase [Ophidiomyces ophidiicola]KAI2025661.1 mannosyltransferase [Ophidiomyces ophidiicola]KAI2042057.1 mannosyltransferase [Ophidiomyces ophidiicola]